MVFFKVRLFEKTHERNIRESVDFEKTELPVRREAGCVVLAIPDKKMNVSKI